MLSRFIFTFLIFAFAFAQTNAQYFQASISSTGNTVIVKVRPNPGGGNISTSLLSFETFVRYPTSASVTSIGAPVSQTTNFPGLSIGLVQTNTTMYPGYTTLWYFWQTTTPAAVSTYLDGVEYEVFRFTVVGSGTPNFQVIHEEDYDPTYLNITSNTSADLTACGSGSCIANVFYGGATMSAGVHISSSSVVLPVSLLVFTATPKENKFIQLNWKASQEYQLRGYEIERSINGISFDKIGFSQASSGVEQFEYSFNDEQVEEDRSYFYRLRMVDIDGSIEYSPIRNAKILAHSLLQLDVYPNPAFNQVHLSVNSKKESNLEVELISESGITLKQLSVEEGLGLKLISFDISTLPAGSYFLRVLGSEVNHSALRFVKQ